MKKLSYICLIKITTDMEATNISNFKSYLEYQFRIICIGSYKNIPDTLYFEKAADLIVAECKKRNYSDKRRGLIMNSFWNNVEKN